MKVSTQLATLRVTRRFTITENHPVVGILRPTGELSLALLIDAEVS